MQNEANEEEKEIKSLLKKSVAMAKPLESAVEAVEPTKAGKSDFLGWQKVYGMIASALQSFEDHIKNLVISIT